MFDHDDYDPVSEVVFTQEQQTMTEKSVTPTKVRVSGPWQVHHDGKLYYQGEQATVPEHIAEQWEQWHLVERVTAKTK